jgi:hypothetical protein|tara:strand:- start:3590 stop:4174 length:585 start_codon:yes stop_codon:yes gene_type:complete
MEEPTNIFYKIFEIMNHYENILDNSSYEGDDKYTEGDDFFAFLFKNMKKQEAAHEKADNTEQNPEKEPEPVPDKESDPEPEPEVDINPIIKSYIKKCYRKIVLKCHPDKNKSTHNADKLFIKCHDYYDNGFLIGLLYIFYLYKLLPPAPLNNTSPTEPDDNSSILIDRIFKEIRMIQDKLTQYDSQMKTQAESS